MDQDDHSRVLAAAILVGSERARSFRQTSSLLERRVFFIGVMALPVFYPGVTDALRAGTISVAAGKEVSNADITLAAAATKDHAVGVLVVDEAGKPLAGSTISVRASSDRGVALSGFIAGRTDNEGGLTMHALAPGRYVIQAIADARSQFLSQPHSLDIPAGDATTIKLEAQTAPIS